MIKGNTIIFNEEYIEEIQRYIDNTEKQYASEVIPAKKKSLEDVLYNLRRKLEHSLDFQDNLEEILNIDRPNLCAVKTTSGKVLPLRIIKVI